MQYWTTTEIDFIVNRLIHSTKEIYSAFCEEYGSSRSYNSIQKKTKKLRNAHSHEPTDIIEDITAEEIADIIQPLPQSIDLFLNDVSMVQKKERREAARSWLKGVIDLSDEMKDKLSYHGSKSIVNSKKTSLCVLLSDTHFGKPTKWFNLETARKRMEEIPQRLYQRSLPDIDEVVVILAGDMVEGEDIYPTQNTHIECSAIEQVQICSESIWQTLLGFRNLFNCPVRVETCPGNHGRVSKSANEKTNWDNVVYHILRVMASMSNDKNIIVNCNFEPFRTFMVKDKIGMAYHHGVKHTGTSSMREKVAGWISSTNFDFMVHGHWHEWHVGNWLGKFVIANGCMCGPDDLAQRMGKEDDARQAYFLVTPGQPVYGFSFIDWVNANP